MMCSIYAARNSEEPHLHMVVEGTNGIRPSCSQRSQVTLIVVVPLVVSEDLGDALTPCSGVIWEVSRVSLELCLV